MALPTLLYTNPHCLDHDTGPHHPERADRLRAIAGILESEEFTWLDRETAPLADREDLSPAHAKGYVDGILAAVPRDGTPHHIDSDTVLSAGSGKAALAAAGAAIAAVDALTENRARNAFCAVRPPGHHAEHAAAMGFCLFNNAAIAALRARHHHGFARVAVVDFDVHHGNGTQDILWNEPGLFYASTHQHPAYPGTGAAGETGGAGRIVNVPLPPGSGSDAFRRAYDEIILPALAGFAPDFLVVSAGFDGHAADPLAQLRLTEEDFAWVTRALAAQAATSAGHRLVSVLEGGYDTDALARSVRRHVRALMGD